MRNVEQKIRSLKLACDEYWPEYSLKEYVLYSAEHDPYFFSWLFDRDVENYGMDMTEEERQEYNSFIESL